MVTKKSCFLGALLTACLNIAMAITPGVDYQILDVHPIPAQLLPSSANTKVKVVEFFSYGCPWCFNLDPSLVAWQKTKGPKVEFERIPVLFQPAWSMFMKVFYVATDLGVENRLHADLFEVVQNTYGEEPRPVNSPFLVLKTVDFSNDRGIQSYFVQKGVPATKVDAVLKDSAKLQQQIDHALALSKTLHIMEIPTVIVNGKYLISNRYTNGDNKKFIDTLNYLIQSQ